MNVRALAIAALVPLVFVAACSSDSDNNTVTGANGTSTVRFVNATGNSNINFANSGVVGTGNSNLAFGGSSSCVTVNSANPNLGFTNSTTGATINGFAPSFQSGGNYTVVAYTDAAGNTQFATLDNSNTPTSGNAGFRVFNAASGSGNLVALGNGTALGTGAGVPFGMAGAWMNVPAGTSALTFNTGAGTSTVATNAGNMTFTSGQNSTLVVGPAAAGTTALRTFSATGC